MLVSVQMLARSGDEPLADDVYNVNQSRTAGDPILRVKAPEGSSTVVVTVEDLALRGGPNYAYRLITRRDGIFGPWTQTPIVIV